MVTDAVGLMDSDSVTISINEVNHQPGAIGKSVTTLVGRPVSIDLSGIDDDGDQLTTHIVTNPVHGNLNSSDSTVIYTPDPTFFGKDQFTFNVSDGKAYSANNASVNILVQPHKSTRPPVADAGQIQEVYEHTKVLLNGTNSF